MPVGTDASSAPLRAVLWDYGNVIVGWDPAHLYARVIEDRARLSFFLTEVCPMSWHLLHDQGRPMSETIPERQALFPAFAAEIAMWKPRFGDMITGAIDGTGALIEALAALDVPQYVLTNMPDEVVDVCFGPFPIARHFKDVIVSGREGVAKPDARIFEIALERMGGLPPETVLFADDSRANVEAARALGFQAVLFEGPEAGPRAVAEALRAGGLQV